MWKFQPINKYSLEFCKHSTIHGVRYFAERGRHWSEYLWWLIAVALSFWWCSSSIRNIWLDWNENPIKIEVTDKEVSIKSIPFPTVNTDTFSVYFYLNFIDSSKSSAFFFRLLQKMIRQVTICPETKVVSQKLNLSAIVTAKSRNLSLDLTDIE